MSGSEDGTARVWRVPPLDPRHGGGAADGATGGAAERGGDAAGGPERGGGNAVDGPVVLRHRGFVTGVER